MPLPLPPLPQVLFKAYIFIGRTEAILFGVPGVEGGVMLYVRGQYFQGLQSPHIQHLSELDRPTRTTLESENNSYPILCIGTLIPGQLYPLSDLEIYQLGLPLEEAHISVKRGRVYLHTKHGKERL